MGCYVNPRNMDKADWLQANGVITGQEPTPITDTHLPVCLVDNGMFTAAAVAYSPRELAEFTRTDDPRRKLWFTVPIEKLREAAPIDSYLR